MKRNGSHQICVQTLLSLLLGVGVFVFFFFYYPYHLHFQEQFQLFRFSADYWWEKAAYPGGISEYISRFLVQFWVYIWAGALIMALLLVGLQRLVAVVAGGLHRQKALYPLSLLPSLLCMALLCDENYMPAAVIQLILALLAGCFCRTIRQPVLRMVCAWLLIPVVYWCCGGCVWMYILLGWLNEAFYFKQLSRRQWYLFVVLGLMLGIAAWLLTKMALQYPISQLWMGRGAHRFLMKLAWNQWWIFTLVWWLIPLIGLTSGWLSDRLAALFIIAASVGVYQSANWEKEELMGYDYHIRRQQWDQAIGMAEAHPPRSSLASTYLSLALGMNGQLGDDLFRYQPAGIDDLLPAFNRDYISPLAPGEVYYYLGLTYTAERFAVEAMDAIPEYEKSARGVKRLAEINLINGQYAVARKYLRLLQQSLFYRGWATEAMTYLYNDEKVGRHPEWGKLRTRQSKIDFLFQDEQKGAMLALLFQSNPDNRMAYEYLLSYALLEKDMERFLSYYDFGGHGVKYDRIPHSFQEALLYSWSLEHSINDEKPWQITPGLEDQIRTYAGIFNADDDAEAKLAKEYGDTYWYYLHFKNNEK